MKDQTREKLEELIGHYYCEDSWYSCPLATDGCANEAETGCTCRLKEKVDQLESLIQQEKQEMLDGIIKHSHYFKSEDQSEFWIDAEYLKALKEEGKDKEE